MLEASASHGTRACGILDGDVPVKALKRGIEQLSREAARDGKANPCQLAEAEAPELLEKTARFLEAGLEAQHAVLNWSCIWARFRKQEWSALPVIVQATGS